MKRFLTDFPYARHRAGLLPLLNKPGTAFLPGDLAAIAGQNEGVFTDFVVDQGLASLWHERLAGVVEAPFSSTFHQRLKTERFNAAAVYLLQKNALATIRSVLDTQGIAHVVFKGAHFRELLYPQPAVRVASDIDLLVAPEDRFSAVAALVTAGFSSTINLDNISHELTLSKGYLDIDLHWDILRPGRTRIPLTEEIIRNRVDCTTHWGPAPEATLFVMLVHPVINKYCTTPHSSVIRLLDILLWMEQMQPDWAAAAKLLERAGLKTAAWIMLEWLRLLTGRLPPEGFMQQISPGRMRRRYLAGWVAGNYSTRLLDHPWLIQLGFTLPAHDRPGDAWRALWSILRARREVGREAKRAVISAFK